MKRQSLPFDKMLQPVPSPSGVQDSFNFLYGTLKDQSAMGKGVVATTHRNGTCSILTSAKLTEGYLVVGITRELDKKPLLY